MTKHFLLLCCNTRWIEDFPLVLVSHFVREDGYEPLNARIVPMQSNLCVISIGLIFNESKAPSPVFQMTKHDAWPRQLIVKKLLVQNIVDSIDFLTLWSAFSFPLTLLAWQGRLHEFNEGIDFGHILFSAPESPIIYTTSDLAVAPCTVARRSLGEQHQDSIDTTTRARCHWLANRTCTAA